MKPHLCSTPPSHTSSHLLHLLSRGTVFWSLGRNKWPETLNWRNCSPSRSPRLPTAVISWGPMMCQRLCICYDIHSLHDTQRWRLCLHFTDEEISVKKCLVPLKVIHPLSDRLESLSPSPESPSLTPEMLSSLAWATAHAVPVLGALQVSLMGCQGWEPLHSISLPINPYVNGDFIPYCITDFFGSRGSCGSTLQKDKCWYRKSSTQFQVIAEILKLLHGSPKSHELKLRSSL